jgi:hypothetical protein
MESRRRVLFAVSLAAGIFCLCLSSLRQGAVNGHKMVSGRQMVLVYAGTNFLSPMPVTRGSVPTSGDVQNILTNPAFRTVMHALEQRMGRERLPQPAVVTISGRGENRIFLTNLYVDIAPAKLSR